jgi:hypothetical protein
VRDVFAQNQVVPKNSTTINSIRNSVARTSQTLKLVERKELRNVSAERKPSNGNARKSPRVRSLK